MSRRAPSTSYHVPARSHQQVIMSRRGAARALEADHSLGSSPGRTGWAHPAPYRRASLIRNSFLLGTYSSICLGPYGGPRGGGRFPMSEVALYRKPSRCHQARFTKPLLSKLGTYKTVKARFWPRLAGQTSYNPFSCPLFARKRHHEAIISVSKVVQRQPSASRASRGGRYLGNGNRQPRSD